MTPSMTRIVRSRAPHVFSMPKCQPQLNIVDHHEYNGVCNDFGPNPNLPATRWLFTDAYRAEWEARHRGAGTAHQTSSQTPAQPPGPREPASPPSTSTPVGTGSDPNPNLPATRWLFTDAYRAEWEARHRGAGTAHQTSSQTPAQPPGPREPASPPSTSTPVGTGSDPNPNLPATRWLFTDAYRAEWEARHRGAGTAHQTSSQTPAQPPGPPRRTGSPSLIGADGVVYDDVPGAGYQPRTRFGLEVTDTSPGGQALTHTSPGLLPARLPGGPLVIGPGASCFTHVRP